MQLAASGCRLGGGAKRIYDRVQHRRQLAEIVLVRCGTCKGESRYMFLQGHYQNAYVTHDLERAKALFADKSDCVPRMHHISLRRENLDDMRAEAERTGLPFVCESGIPDLVYVYLDARRVLGHFLEYVWASPAGWEMVGRPEGRPAQ